MVEKKREKEGGGRFYFLKFKYSFRVDEEEGRKKSSEIILAIPPSFSSLFFASTIGGNHIPSANSGRRGREEEGTHVRVSARDLLTRDPL